MLQYDKIIVDTSNIFYRVLSTYKNTDSSLSNAKQVSLLYETFKNYILQLKMHTFGEVDLLFDPLSSGKGLNERAKKKETYKANRRKETTPQTTLRVTVLDYLYKFFTVENESRINVYHSLELEADDYVEKLTEKGNCLLLTSDLDWARYLEKDRVEMLNEGLIISEDHIYTAQKFSENPKHPFIPNIITVTLWKTFYGDASDDIEGVWQNQAVRVLRDCLKDMMEIIKKIGTGEIDKDFVELKREFFSGSGVFLDLSEKLKLTNTNCSYEKLLDLTSENFELIESKLPRSSDIDINKYKTNVSLVTKDIPVKKKFTLSRRK